MNIWNLHIGQQIRELNRLRHIAEILARNGLGMLLDQTEFGRFLPRGWRRRIQKSDPSEISSPAVLCSRRHIRPSFNVPSPSILPQASNVRLPLSA